MSKYDGRTKIWHGPQIPYRYAMDVMLGDLVLEKLAATPERILQICADDETTLTCEQLRLSSIRVAQHLEKIGIKEDDVIGLITHHSHFATCFITGCILIGAIVNPLDVQMSESDIHHVYNESKPKVILCDDEAILKLKKALQSVDFNYRIYSTTKGTSSNFQLNAQNFVKPTGDEAKFKAPKLAKPSDQQLLAILCSSGTTGMTKSVCVTHATSIEIISYLSLTPVSTPSKSLSFSPLYWVSGFYSNLIITFSENEIRIFTDRKFSVDIFIGIVEAYQISDVLTAPYGLNTLMNSQNFLSSNKNSLKNITLAGAIFSQEARQTFDEILPNINLNIAYGMTEIAATLTKPFEYRQGLSVGSFILPNVSLKIIDDDGNALDNGKTGEICLKPKFKFLVSLRFKAVAVVANDF